MSADRATSLLGSRWTCALVSLLGAFAALTPTSLISPVLAIVAWVLMALLWAVPGLFPLGRAQRPLRRHTRRSTEGI